MCPEFSRKAKLLAIVASLHHFHRSERGNRSIPPSAGDQAVVAKSREDGRNRRARRCIGSGATRRIGDRPLARADDLVERGFARAYWAGTTEDEIKAAIFNPPETTRAFFRGRAVALLYADAGPGATIRDEAADLIALGAGLNRRFEALAPIAAPSS